MPCQYVSNQQISKMSIIRDGTCREFRDSTDLTCRILSYRGLYKMIIQRLRPRGSEMYDFPVYIYWLLLYYVQQILENGCRLIVTLAELCNHKLAWLVQVPHRTADREDPKLSRQKWQPPHIMRTPNGKHTRKTHLNKYILTVTINNLFGFSIYSVLH